MLPLYTIGHSNYTSDAVIQSLLLHNVNAVADVRSNPVSRINPDFNRNSLTQLLNTHGLQYVFLGKELGGRPDNPACYRDGQVDYDLVKKTALFAAGIQRLTQGLSRFRIALLCAERDPLNCHRGLLICRHLREFDIHHLRGDGSSESHSLFEQRLLQTANMEERSMFECDQTLLENAYAKQSRRAAYSMTTPRGVEAQ